MQISYEDKLYASDLIITNINILTKKSNWSRNNVIAGHQP